MPAPETAESPAWSEDFPSGASPFATPADDVPTTRAEPLGLTPAAAPQMEWLTEDLFA